MGFFIIQRESELQKSISVYFKYSPWIWIRIRTFILFTDPDPAYLSHVSVLQGRVHVRVGAVLVGQSQAPPGARQEARQAGRLRQQGRGDSKVPQVTGFSQGMTYSFQRNSGEIIRT